jgi:hypothetical protein
MAIFQISNFKSQMLYAVAMYLLIAHVAMAAAPSAVPISGKPFSANLVAIDADGQLTFQIEQKQYTMPMADLVSWGQCPEQGRAGGLVLADGGWLAAEPISAYATAMTVSSELFGTLKIPLAAISGVLFRSSSNLQECDRRFDRLSGRDRNQQLSPLPSERGQNSKNSPLPLGEGQGVRAVDSDRLLLDNGDELTGKFLALTNDTVKFEAEVGPIDVKTDRITALIFKPAQLKAKNQAWAGFSDGSRLLVSQVFTKNDKLHIITVGQPLAASQIALVFLQPLDGPILYLSDLQPSEYHQTPYLDLPWPYHTDRNVTGGFLRCARRLYLKGIGVHSAARLIYALSPLPLGEGQGVRALGAPNYFQAELAIDDSASAHGSVQFRVFIDGQERYASPILRGGQPPIPISIDIRGAGKLELVVDYADRADVLDHADWLNARLIK